MLPHLPAVRAVAIHGPAIIAVRLAKHDIKPGVGGHKHRVVDNVTVVTVDE